MTARVIAVACTAACLCAGGAGLAAAAAPQTITVTGTGTVTGAPDELKLSLETDAQAASVSAALGKANRAMTAVRDALTADHVAPADLQTSGLSVQVQYDSRSTITGYTVSESLTAELHGLATAGQVITDAIDAGGDTVRVNDVQLDLADQSATLMAKARAKAITDARDRAGQYATAAGMRLGQVLSISETESNPPVRSVPETFGVGSPVPISAGTLQMTTSVVVVYQMEGYPAGNPRG
jgi:uncharacterized protein YggE